MKKLALIGVGRWGQNYLKTVPLIPDCKIEYTRGRDYHDLKDKKLDGIIVASPASTHAEIIRFFPDTPLLVEKPLVTSRKDLDFENKKVMVGHTYLYDSVFSNLSNKRIDYLTFMLRNNDSYKSKTSMLFELGPHGISLGLYLFGSPTSIRAGYMADGNIRIVLGFLASTLDYQFGWNYENKERLLFADGRKIEIVEPYRSPLEEQIRSFLHLIDGGESITGLDHARRVTIILLEIEKQLHENNHSYPLF